MILLRALGACCLGFRIQGPMEISVIWFVDGYDNLETTSGYHW